MMIQASHIYRGQVPPAAPPLGPDVQAHLGRQLRATFREMANEPVPNRFMAVIGMLEKDMSARGGRLPATQADAPNLAMAGRSGRAASS
jgi:hypothetical protein